MAEQQQLSSEQQGVLLLGGAALLSGLLIAGNWDSISQSLPLLRFIQSPPWPLAVALGIATSILYPIAGALIFFLIGQPLIYWASGETATRDVRLWLTALWPISIPACIIICPVAGIIRMLFFW